MSLGFFPPIHAEEDFRSLVYRFHIRSGNENIVQTNMDLFDTASLNFQLKNLSVLSNKVNLVKPTKIIDNHTLFPLLSPFVKQEHKEHLYSGIINTSQWINFYTKLPYVSSDTIRYCPICVNEDFSKFNEVFIKRFHQCVFLKTCYIHGVELITECQYCGDVFGGEKTYGQKNYLITNCCKSCGVKIDNVQIVEVDNIEKGILEDIKYIMSNKDSINLENLQSKYMAWMYAKGYTRSKLDINIDLKKLINDIHEYYGEKFFEKFDQDKDRLIKDGHFSKILFGKIPSKKPFLHIIFMRFISKSSVENFFDLALPPVYQLVPFGHGPWECLNNICDNYRKKIITKCLRNITRVDRVRGQFVCPSCGFNFMKSWDMYNEVEKPSYSIIDHGTLIRDSILEVYGQTNSIELTAKITGISRGTVKNVIPKVVQDYSKRLTEDKELTLRVFNVLEVYFKCMSIRETARKTGTTSRTIRKYLDMMNSCNLNPNELQEIAATLQTSDKKD